MDSKEIYDQVNRRYGTIAKSNSGKYEQKVARAFGYSEEELAALPEGANLGLSCGNPFALAKIREGETILDLGSGAGFDVFTAAKKVGGGGMAIGVDMNKAMLDKANKNRERINATNVRFIDSTITSIPLPDATVDCIISNCVINLVPAADKQIVFNEIYRLLKPLGRVAISDILARKEFTDKIRESAALYVGCVAGASQVHEYDAFLRNAGFEEVLIVDNRSDLNVYFAASDDGISCSANDDVQEDVSTCCMSPDKSKLHEPADVKSDCGGEKACTIRDQSSSLQSDARAAASMSAITDFNEWAGSFQVYAVKPACAF